MRDMKNKRKRKNFFSKYIFDASGLKEEYIMKLERTFKFSYDRDLYYIDDNISLYNQNYTLVINNELKIVTNPLDSLISEMAQRLD